VDQRGELPEGVLDVILPVCLDLLRDGGGVDLAQYVPPKFATEQQLLTTQHLKTTPARCAQLITILVKADIDII
jgi:hypothetical protein